MNDKKAFIKGTLILTIANIISKILGAVFKIPLTYLLKEEGMAVFNTAGTLYSIFLGFIISGIPLASSRLISADLALNRPEDAKKTVSVSSKLLAFIGAVASVLLFILARPLSIAMKDPASELSVKIISPSLFFVAYGYAFKSYFQGSSKLTSHAISQVVEALLRLGVGYFLAYKFVNSSIGIRSASATAGITVGEIVATLILSSSYYLITKKIKKKSQLSEKSVLISLSQIAVGMFICSVFTSLFNLLDTATIRNTLLQIKFTPQSSENLLLKYSSYTDVFNDLHNNLRLSHQAGRWLYGAYSGYALTVFHLPLGILATLSVCILPLISGNLAKNNLSAMRSSVIEAVRISLTGAVAAAVLLFIFSDDILNLLFKNTASAYMLRAVSPCLIFLSLSNIFTSVYNSAGKIYTPFIISIFGTIIKIILNLILIKIPSLNIFGAIISSNIAFLFICVMQGKMLARSYCIEFTSDIFTVPFISSLPMILCCYLLKQPMNCLFGRNIISLGLTVFASSLAYLLTVSLLSKESNPFPSFKKILQE